MKPPGSKYGFWSGVIGLDTTLCVFDGADPAVLPSQMSASTSAQ